MALKRYIELIISVLTVLYLTVCCQVTTKDNFKKKIIKTESKCHEEVNMNPRYDGYSLFVKLNPYECDESRLGFKCETLFRVPDAYDLLGSKLCVDVQGVDDSVRNECQLYLDVIKPNSTKVLRSVHCSSYLMPADSPYYICTEGNNLTLLLETRPSVQVCPTIYEYLFTQSILMGHVTLRPKISIYHADLGSCVHDPLPDANSFIVKVVPPSYQSSVCSRYESTYKLNFSKMRGCLTLLYMSNNYYCNVDVTLNSDRDSTMLKLTASRGQDVSTYMKPASVCKEFDADDGDVILGMRSAPEYPCYGKFVFEVSFLPLSDGDDDDDDSQLNSPRVFMAVFIALIIICLICLGLTCLCCIRFRTKRLRNARRRHRHGAPTPNQGFDGTTGPMPPHEGNISWSQSNPGAIFGLPSYEDITGERSSGVNPSDSGDPKDDLPPAYDSIFSSES